MAVKSCFPGVLRRVMMKYVCTLAYADSLEAEGILGNLRTFHGTIQDTVSRDVISWHRTMMASNDAMMAAGDDDRDHAR